MRESRPSIRLLVEDLLYPAKWGQNEPMISVSSLGPEALVSDEIRIFEPIARRKGVNLASKVHPELPAISVDYSYALRVFGTLIGNAVKFLPANGEVVIEATQDVKGVRFNIINEVPGMTPEQAERAFDAYWQADSAERRGVGPGLAIVKRLIEAHGGVFRP